MYCAVLNQIRIVGFRRTNASTMKAVTPLTNIGQGWPRTATEAKNGMNPTEVFTLANGIRKKNESLTIPSSAKAARAFQDRKSTRLNSSHLVISYAVFCLKQKNYC